MIGSMLIWMLVASLWRLCAAVGFIYPGPERSGSTDLSKNMVLCLDQRITIRWSFTTEKPGTTLGMVLWAQGYTLPAGAQPYSMYKGPNSESYTWSVDTGDDYTKYPFRLDMYVFGSTTPSFRSELFNISNCAVVSAPQSQSVTSPAPLPTTPRSNTTPSSPSSPSSRTSPVSPTSPLQSTPSPSKSSPTTPTGTTPATPSGSGSGSGGTTPVVNTALATGSSVATVINAGPGGVSNDGSAAVGAPFRAVAAGLLGQWLFAIL